MEAPTQFPTPTPESARTELFSREQLARHARSLAKQHPSIVKNGPNQLLNRLDRNERVLRAYNRSTSERDQIRRVTHAAEWLLDNFFLIEEQIQTARRHLPKGYSNELPRLTTGSSAGLPRVYAIVFELISHADAQIEVESLREFVAAYQTVTGLRLGELWAVPIMLRLALIENLREITLRLTTDRSQRDLADEWAARLESVDANNRSQLVVVVAEMAQTDLPVTSAFVAEFYQRLSLQNTSGQMARNWLQLRLEEQGTTVEQLVQQDSQRQASDQISISHTIASLRLLSAVDWRDFVESISLVDATLRTDPAGIYPRMDFATRDRYRHAVEAASRHGALSETEVANQAVALAESGRSRSGADDRTGHVGYYLIDRGVEELERVVRVRRPWRDSAGRLIQRFPGEYYLGGIGAITTVVALALWVRARALGVPPGGLIALVLPLGLAASQIAVALLNWISGLLVKPRLLPRLDFHHGISADCATMVVVPTLLGSAEAVARLLETIEIHYLSNRDAHLRFALLTDFPDALQEEQPDDAALLAAVAGGIEQLNQRYAADRPSIFMLFHRPRRWNAAEGRWMGYERKRGKITEFNAFLRGGAREAFSTVVGDRSLLNAVRFVITLDTDTRLPPEAARQLAGALAHPLNRPKFDPRTGLVVEGYGILQPRMGVSLPGSNRSWFVRLFAGEPGIDPYTRASSDVYQDVFQEGSFIGKGIYDVDAFEHALGGRLPENAVLSHDLIESCYARSALVSDVELYEEHPARYNTDVTRRHRWIRGDWQIAQWLLPWIPGPDGERPSNPLSGLSRWKILDNLRRSLVPAALMVLLLGAWLWLPELGQGAALLALGVVLLPAVLALISDVLRKPEDLPLPIHLRHGLNSAVLHFGQSALAIAFLPYDAFINLDAIGRTLLRVLFTRRRLLEWQTASDAERGGERSLAGFYRAMWIVPLVSLAGAGALAELDRGLLPSSLPLLLLWCAAPALAWWISQPLSGPPFDLSPGQTAFLRRTARRTWKFFEHFVTAEDHWLPPDNFQEQPSPVVATRTSPTNLGLALLANLTAVDFGYSSVGNCLQRTRNTLATMARLERYRGHFFNWYETRRLETLLPKYISSVDSGNLAGHLLTLGPGLIELADRKILPPEVFAGLGDALGLARELMANASGLARLEADLSQAPASLAGAWAVLERSLAQVAELTAGAAGPPEGLAWLRTLEADCRAHRDEVVWLAPWLLLPPPPRASEVPAEVTARWAELDAVPTLRQVSELAQSLVPWLAEVPEGTAYVQALQTGSDRASERIRELAELARQSDEFAQMDFSFLFDAKRSLFSIGYNVAEQKRDASYYDLLASEARLCSYVAVAQGQVPQEHWFALGRLLVAVRKSPVLVSWSGSMFEYLMPLLVMPSYEHTLLEQTCAGAVRQQIDYGQLRRIPWGISESGYNVTDAQDNYQYKAFGVPGLGLKRGLADDLVIAPYASVMALMVAPRAACENLERLQAEGRGGLYGFYEAVDYTPSRLPPGQTSVTVFSYMVHHQGMGFLSLSSALLGLPMQRRFMACPILRAADLLLQERVPRVEALVLSGSMELDKSRKLAAQKESRGAMRIMAISGGASPEVQLLSNGRYHVVVSSGGGGYSRWRDLAVTRWREDSTRDHWGAFIYLRDVASGNFWSATYQPTTRAAKGYETIFTQARAEFRRAESGLSLHTEISVSPEDDLELRRLTLTNSGVGPRTIELTSFAEVVLAPAGADAAHPAFSNLFVQTEFLPDSGAILCTRRARSNEERPPWLFHVIIGPDSAPGQVSCETDRSRFVGRGRSPARPAALQTGGALSNTTGAVLDPIVALRRTLLIPAGETARVDFLLGMAETRETALALVEKYQTARISDRAFDLAWTHSQVTLRHLNITEEDAQLFARLAGPLIYANAARRAAPSVLLSNRRGQSGLWGFGISGDLPIVVVRIGDGTRIELIRQLVQAHAYWRVKGLAAELVIINDDASGYRKDLQEQITGIISSSPEAQLAEKAGGIFVRRQEQLTGEDRALLLSVARIVLSDEGGSLSDQWDRPIVSDPALPALGPLRPPVTDPRGTLPARELIFDNGFGGFTPDGREYVIRLADGKFTPAPWVNVLANPSFGTVVSESGGGYTWVENSHEFRVTPWNNDPVSDPVGEAFYLRDEHTGEIWSPLPAPARGAAPYVVRHGFGYTVFEHTEHGIVSELWMYVAMDAPVKFAALKLRNISGRPRRLSATGYWEWVLGELRGKNLLHVHTEVDPKSGALLARNPYSAEFSERIVFVDVNDPARTVTGDRKEFIGRNGSLAEPAALKRTRLSGRVGAGLDPCGAVQLGFDLASGGEREVLFRLGVGASPADVQTLIQRYRRPGAGRAALEAVWQYWNQTLGAVNFETPDPAVNIMANGWLLYQTLSCRLWGRTGFYQSGGAFGFRDQLQDSMALIHAEPGLAREQLLRAAAHQFREGDVQHWWHPPLGRGVRTHFSDDYLWLPFALCRYVNAIGDTGVLNEPVSFLEGRAVKPDEESYYDLPSRSAATAPLYDHAVRAIEHGLRFGDHGLPLMGCGDWNDGMNRVGKEGKGESVWLAFFLYDVLRQFMPLARARGDGAFAERCELMAGQVQTAIEAQAWDGQWYKRAYYDSGDPLGSRTSGECEIDSLPQSWAIISGAGAPERARQGMASVGARLVKPAAGIIQLFDPPFDHTPRDPGYIKGYIPGVRENGGQYTHAAIWTTMAFALMGETEQAWELARMLNPLSHGGTPEQISVYKVEPYVIAADIYAFTPHVGRGGWTWYTGSAGWMYRLLAETLLGVTLEPTRLRLAPRWPQSWMNAKIHYRHRRTLYHITVKRIPTGSGETPRLILDGQIQPDNSFPLAADEREHAVELWL
jgi:cyclic beta-1,2-glucan synthetase